MRSSEIYLFIDNMDYYYYDPPPPCSGSVLHTPHPQHPFSTRFHPYSHSFPSSYSPSWHPPLLPKQPSSMDFSHYESLQPQPLPPMPPSLNSVHVAKDPKISTLSSCGICTKTITSADCCYCCPCYENDQRQRPCNGPETAH